MLSGDNDSRCGNSVIESPRVLFLNAAKSGSESKRIGIRLTEWVGRRSWLRHLSFDFTLRQEWWIWGKEMSVIPWRSRCPFAREDSDAVCGPIYFHFYNNTQTTTDGQHPRRRVGSCACACVRIVTDSRCLATMEVHVSQNYILYSRPTTVQSQMWTRLIRTSG